eukprot:Skav210478  [mRNA]  locus=scaffold737:607081:609628:- [translate_table: standard]
MDRELLGLPRPEQLIWFSVPVPPVCIRPTVSARNSTVAAAAARSMGDRGTREDDLTAAEMAGLPQIKGKMVRSLCSRLKGKEGRCSEETDALRPHGGQTHKVEVLG